MGAGGVRNILQPTSTSISKSENGIKYPSNLKYKGFISYRFKIFGAKALVTVVIATRV